MTTVLLIKLVSVAVGIQTVFSQFDQEPIKLQSLLGNNVDTAINSQDIDSQRRSLLMPWEYDWAGKSHKENFLHACGKRKVESVCQQHVDQQLHQKCDQLYQGQSSVGSIGYAFCMTKQFITDEIISKASSAPSKFKLKKPCNEHLLSVVQTQTLWDKKKYCTRSELNAQNHDKAASCDSLPKVISKIKSLATQTKSKCNLNDADYVDKVKKAIIETRDTVLADYLNKEKLIDENTLTQIKEQIQANNYVDECKLCNIPQDIKCFCCKNTVDPIQPPTDVEKQVSFVNDKKVGDRICQQDIKSLAKPLLATVVDTESKKGIKFSGEVATAIIENSNDLLEQQKIVKQLDIVTDQVEKAGVSSKNKEYEQGFEQVFKVLFSLWQKDKIDTNMLFNEIFKFKPIKLSNHELLFILNGISKHKNKDKEKEGFGKLLCNYGLIDYNDNENTKLTLTSDMMNEPICHMDDKSADKSSDTHCTPFFEIVKHEDSQAALKYMQFGVQNGQMSIDSITRVGCSLQDNDSKQQKTPLMVAWEKNEKFIDFIDEFMRLKKIHCYEKTGCVLPDTNDRKKLSQSHQQRKLEGKLNDKKFRLKMYEKFFQDNGFINKEMTGKSGKKTTIFATGTTK